MLSPPPRRIGSIPSIGMAIDRASLTGTEAVIPGEAVSAWGPEIYQWGPYDSGQQKDPYGSRYGDWGGTSARVDVAARRIYVNREDDRSLRNGGDYGGSSGQAVLYFDDRTRVD